MADEYWKTIAREQRNLEEAADREGARNASSLERSLRGVAKDFRRQDAEADIRSSAPAHLPNVATQQPAPRPPGGPTPTEWMERRLEFGNYIVSAGLLARTLMAGLADYEVIIRPRQR
jgi:hypothetical protein